MSETKLGKIERVEFGVSGYQDCCIGIHITLQGEGWGVCTDKSAWDASKVKHTEHCKWTEESRSKSYDEIVRYISGLLNDAKCNNVSELKGKPIEATFEAMALTSWRILKEVL